MGKYGKMMEHVINYTLNGKHGETMGKRIGNSWEMFVQLFDSSCGLLYVIIRNKPQEGRTA